MRLVLVRRAYMPEGTFGYVSFGNLTLVTLELPWAGNHPSESCIPIGIYPLRWRESPRLGWVLRVEPVPGRSDIEIHAANRIDELRGCIAVGMTEHLEMGECTIAQSVRAMDLIRALRATSEPTELQIINYLGGMQ